ncbi:hypothetical protein BJ944DRAFT_245209, partial [Cunninghamella echinulata]
PPPSSNMWEWWNDGKTLPKANKDRAIVGKNPFLILDTTPTKKQSALLESWTPIVSSSSSLTE